MGKSSHRNMFACISVLIVQIQSILDENAAWEKEESKKGDRLYWEHRHYLDLQIDGLYDGYMIANEGKPERVCPCLLYHP